MAIISNNDIASAIYGVLENKKEVEHAPVFKEIVKFLDRRRLFSKAPSILKKLEEIINLKENRLMVRVSSARQLDEKTRKELIILLMSKYQSKDVELKERLDEKLLGGVRLEINDEVIDLTLKKQIEKLKEHLTTTHE